MDETDCCKCYMCCSIIIISLETRVDPLRTGDPAAQCFIRLVVPELIASLELLVSQIPGVLRSFFDWLEKSEMVSENTIEPFLGVDWEAKIEQFLSVLAMRVGNIMGAAINIVTSVSKGGFGAVPQPSRQLRLLVAQLFFTQLAA